MGDSGLSASRRPEKESRNAALRLSGASRTSCRHPHLPPPSPFPKKTLDRSTYRPCYAHGALQRIQTLSDPDLFVGFGKCASDPVPNTTFYIFLNIETSNKFKEK
jgi:hypothetical protein